MKLIQLNAWGGRVDGPLRDFLEDEKPDIFCGQEIISFGAGDSILFLPLEEIQKIINVNYSAFGACASFPFMGDQAYYGNVVLSKPPIIKYETIFTNLKFVDNFNFEEHDYNIRNFVHAVIECSGKKINVITHHGHHIQGHKNGSKDTAIQMEMLAKYIDELKGPVILTGDFNLSPESKSLTILNSRLRNLSIEHKLETTRNQLTCKTEVCDYILINDQVVVNDFYASSKVVSDHKALILEFEVKK